MFKLWDLEEQSLIKKVKKALPIIFKENTRGNLSLSILVYFLNIFKIIKFLY